MKYTVLLFIILFFSEIRAQNGIELKLENGVENRELQTILMFENIIFEALSFNGALKDFLGEENKMLVPSENSFPIYGIIPPI
ncbi:hypothetical protein JM83_2259 [Gillisia sp. Hel_I_86]|uniref:hypothetical protein n=1 Tax=Gillisia sp. Hel_I_86 TaxID=1249981 RepID=UPI00119AD5EA|nr:hypothetical protein [Gillisia sp. Hel_I_86]TVZ27231.1 hypothetical protein JM83_2259 [Gillisia sp. Hel_I_86]